MNTTKPTLLFYCQHVLGMGHLMRSRALVEGLCTDFAITFLNGGELIPGFAFPPGVEVINLPPLKSDAAFSGLTAVGEASLGATKAARTQLVLASYANLQPDLLVIELFPFGRKKFGFELMPLLAQIQRNRLLGTGKPTQVVCSLRDIMVSRPDQWTHEARACRMLNRYFDLLLVHADPTFQRLEESFGQTEAIKTPLLYTGYVAQQEAADDPEAAPLASEGEITLRGEPLILASIGGGRVGIELLQAMIGASRTLAPTFAHQLLLFTGPYLPDADFALLAELVADQPQIMLRRYTNRFLHYMGQAALSVSMAGYNTCMNILTTGVRALLLPFTGGDNDEQQIRADKLAAMGAAGLLSPAELTPTRLAERIVAQLALPPAATTLDLNGVANSVTALRTLAAPPALPPRHRVASWRTVETPGLDALANQLRPFLDQWGERWTAGQPSTPLFLRDDDADEEEETLRTLLDVTLAQGVPINLEVIPGTLTDRGAQLLADYKRFTPELIQLDQHGWLHTNHEPVGRKCEFGPSRSYAQQYEDIARGQTLLAATLPKLISPVFTPPWNRCTADTFRVLDELGFAVFSGLRTGQAVTGYRFQELSVTLDLYQWKGGAMLKDPALIIAELIGQIQAGAPIGLLLHHKVMDRAAFAFLDRLLATLCDYPFMAWYTFDRLRAHPHLVAV